MTKFLVSCVIPCFCFLLSQLVSLVLSFSNKKWNLALIFRESAIFLAAAREGICRHIVRIDTFVHFLPAAFESYCPLLQVFLKINIMLHPELRNGKFNTQGFFCFVPFSLITYILIFNLQLRFSQSEHIRITSTQIEKQSIISPLEVLLILPFSHYSPFKSNHW